MNNEAFLLGYPVEFKSLCLIYPPKVKDIVGNNKFNQYIRLLTISQEEIEDEYTKKGYDLNNLLTPFEYLFSLAYNDVRQLDLIQEAFYSFIHEPVLFIFEQKTLAIGKIDKDTKIEQIRFMQESDYFEFQNYIRLALGQKIIEPPNPNEDPRIKAIKAKARLRDQIKAKKGMGLNFESSLTSICCMNMGINLLNIGELSYPAVFALIRRYQEKEKYDTDIASLLAGADSKKVKPKYWIRNLDD